MQPPSHTVRAQDSLSAMSVPIISSSVCLHAGVFCLQGDMTGRMADAKTGMKHYHPKNCRAKPQCHSSDATESCESYSPIHVMCEPMASQLCSISATWPDMCCAHFLLFVPDTSATLRLGNKMLFQSRVHSVMNV